MTAGELRRRVAVHEAGHSCLALLHGDGDFCACKIFGDTVENICGLSGQTEAIANSPPPRGDGAPVSTFETLPMKQLLALAAQFAGGTLAVEIWDGRRLFASTYIGGPDGRWVDALARSACGPGASVDEHDAFRLLSMARAWRLLTSYWIAVIAVAGELERTGSLTAEEVAALFWGTVVRARKAGLKSEAHPGGGAIVQNADGQLLSEQAAIAACALPCARAGAGACADAGATPGTAGAILGAIGEG